MEEKEVMDFDKMMVMKERRRSSREKGKRTFEGNKANKIKSKKRNVKKISYNPNVDYNEENDDYLDD